MPTRINKAEKKKVEENYVESQEKPADRVMLKGGKCCNTGNAGQLLMAL